MTHSGTNEGASWAWIIKITSKTNLSFNYIVYKLK